MSQNQRSLRQEEIDGFWRFEFVNAVLDYIKEGKVAKFVVVGETSKYRLVEIEQKVPGEWSFSISGKGSHYCYKYGLIVDLLEQMWEKSEEVLELDGEIEISTHFNHLTANVDADPDTKVEDGS